MNSKPNRKAVIDLGTNTFHLLIVDLQKEGEWQEIFRERAYVYLASTGIGKIGSNSFNKGIDTLNYFKKVMDDYDVDEFKAIGTAALRSASNRIDFIHQVKAETNIEIEVINGDREATYISEGVKLALGDSINEYLIMDIGGGSVEFIVNVADKVKWQQSFPVGLAILKSQAFFTDPLDKQAQKFYKEYILKQIEPLYHIPELRIGFPLVGASGTFDALLQLVPFSDVGRISKKVEVTDLHSLYEEIIPLSHSERLEYSGIPNERAEFFPLAIHLVKTIVDSFATSTLYISPFALKEGVLQSMK